MFQTFKNDLMASLVVFLIALPLCLAIALASGAPLFAGIIAGVFGGIVVGLASGSALGVSGPAAGLVVIVFTALQSLGSWPAFLVAVVIAGILQLMMGYAKAGFIAHFFPYSVIQGMLAGIGLLIIIKQLPHALGYDSDAAGTLSYFQMGGESSFIFLDKAIHAFTPAAIFISSLSLLVLIVWESYLAKKHRLFQIIQGPVVVVCLGIAISSLMQSHVFDFSLAEEHFVRLPVANSFREFCNQFSFPDFSAITHIQVWKTAIVLALVASIETLLCVEATDKLDPFKRVTPTNRELKAQGLGNILSGLLGGLPIAQVIVRSSANISFGGKTKLSTILHGFFLLISAATIAKFLNLIPLASLAAILMVIGYKLAKPALFSHLYRLGTEQFIPFIATIIGILATDLLKGIAIGMSLGVFYTLRHSYRNAYYMKDSITKENAHSVHHLVLAEEVSFFNKASIIQALEAIPANSKVVIDCSNSKSIAYDVVQCLRDYKVSAKLKNIRVETIGFIEPA